LISSLEIDKIGQHLLGSSWLGVFPLDHIPMIEPGGFIVNTQTSNLPGEHWIAVYIKPFEINVFDPLGCYYPSLLVNTLERMSCTIKYNKYHCQDPLTQSCGQYCLLWLTSMIL
jgi:hypothetical protein